MLGSGADQIPWNENVIESVAPKTSIRKGEGCYFLVFVQLPGIREIRDFNREKYGTNRESVTLQGRACKASMRFAG
eukprot:SAG31_NODE_3096_length_4680_cov_1.703995_9_plen_76_part_00